jgi:hypothetical protein
MANTAEHRPTSPLENQFHASLNSLVEQIRRDRSILAAILCGSLSHDTVWSKSDIDLVLITIDDKKADREGLSLYADGINVHAILMPRGTFRKIVEGSLRNSFQHSLLAKGRLLYTHDETIEALCGRLGATGDRDLKLQLLSAANHALPCLYKAQKWLITRGDLDYTALWLLYTANELARIEVLNAGIIVDREVLPRALTLNPSVFSVLYTGLLNSPKVRDNVEAALSVAEEYLSSRTQLLFAPILEHLTEAGEARSATEIEDHFHRNFGIGGITMACEYLADQCVIGKASIPVRLTKRSNVDLTELAFFYGSRLPDVW